MAHSPIPPHDGAPHPADMANRTAVAPLASPAGVSRTNETQSAVLGARARAEIEARTYMALNRPRDIHVFRERLLAACDRFRFADAAMYEKPVGDGKSATGLSIRFAEEAARHYGNLDVAVTVVSEDDDRRVIEAVAVDLESNLTHRTQAVVPKYVERLNPRQGDEVLGSRTNSRGKTTYRVRANDDAMFTIHQAAAAKAKREVILTHIPSDIKEECEERIIATMQTIGDKDPDEFRDSMLRSFHNIGVSREQLETFLGKSATLYTVAEMHLLRRILASIKQGEATWADVAAQRAAEVLGKESAPAEKGASGLRAKVEQRASATTKTEEAK